MPICPTLPFTTNGRRCPVVVKTTQKSILELSPISAIFAAKVSLNCFNPRSHIYYATEILYLILCQDIMVALLDDKLLDYRTIFPFLFVDIALYHLLEKNYFNGRLPPNHY